MTIIVERRIYHIRDQIDNVEETQLGFESIDDPDLDFHMWGGKDNLGNVTKWLSKDYNARVNDLGLLGVMTSDIPMNSYSVLNATCLSGFMDDDSETNRTRLQFSRGEGSQRIDLFSEISTPIIEGRLRIDTAALMGVDVEMSALIGTTLVRFLATDNNPIITDAAVSMTVSDGETTKGFIAVGLTTGINIVADDATTGSISLSGAAGVYVTDSASSGAGTWGGPLYVCQRSLAAKADAQASWAALKEKTVTEKSIVEMFVELYTDNLSASLAEGAIGVGITGNKLGDDVTYLHWTATNQLHLGSDTPEYLSTNQGLYVAGRFELTNDAYLGGHVHLFDDKKLRFGSTAVTGDSSIYWDDTNSACRIASTGKLTFDDGYRGTSWDLPIGLGTAQAWIDVKTDWSGEYTILEILHKLKTSSGDVSLDAAYDGGRTITADEGYVGISIPIGGSSSALSVSNLATDNTDDLLNLYQTCTSAYSIYLGGDDSGDFGAHIGSDLQCSFVRVDGDFTSKLHFLDDTPEVGVTEEIELSISHASASNRATLLLSMNVAGSTYLAQSSLSSDTVSITALTGNLTLNSMNGEISCSDSPVTNVTSLSFHDIDTPSGTTTLTINLATGSPFQRKAISANVTSITITHPLGPSSGVIRITTDGTARTVTGFADTTACPINWGNTVNPNATALSIAANSWAEFTFRYWDETTGYTFTVVEPAP